MAFFLLSCSISIENTPVSQNQETSQNRVQKLELLIEPKNILVTGEFHSPKLVLSDENRNQEPRHADITWISNDETVAHVNPFGMIAALSPGTAKIKAMLRSNLDVYVEFEIKVIEKLGVKNIEVKPNELTLEIGKSEQLIAVVELGDGTFNGNVNWSSEDSRIIHVDSNGKITALKPGVASIIATYSPNTKNRASVKVEVVKELKSVQTVATSNPKPPLSIYTNNSPSPLNIKPSQAPTSEKDSSPDPQNSTLSPTPTPLNPLASATPTASPEPTITPLTTPAAPSGLNASEITSSSFKISWGSVSNANRYNVYKNNILLVGDLAATNYTVTGLKPNTNYALQISAINSNGESFKSSILSITTQKISVTVSTLAGNGDGINGIGGGFSDGIGTDAQFNHPSSVAIDSSGNIFVAEGRNHRIRKITSSGLVTTLAGNGSPGFADGTGTSAQFNNPVGVAVDKNDNIYVADQRNHRIRMISSDGIVSTLAGNGISGFADGGGEAAQFNNPKDVAVDKDGHVYVVDRANYCIRKITPSGLVSTFAGNGTSGYVDGIGTNAQFSFPNGIALNSNSYVYIADSSRIRKISPEGVVSTIAGGASTGSIDGTGTAARFASPSGLAIDSAGNIFVADSHNQRIRKITTDGIVSTLAGSTYGYADGPGLLAKFYLPLGVAVSPSGIIYVAEQTNHRIRKISTNP